MIHGLEGTEITIDKPTEEIKRKDQGIKAEMPRVKVVGVACIVMRTVMTGT